MIFDCDDRYQCPHYHNDDRVQMVVITMVMIMIMGIIFSKIAIMIIASLYFQP